MIDFNFENNAQLAAGSILVSEPFLSDEYFSRSVIFLCEHNDEGSFGFVLNKYIDTTVSELVDDFPITSTKLSLGGPVDTSNLFYMHDLAVDIPNSTPTALNMSIGGDFEILKELLRLNPEKINKVRFFIGYSGWAKDQLKVELEEKAWIVLNNITIEQVLDTANKDIWKDILRRLGGKFDLMSRFPKNPSDN